MNQKNKASHYILNTFYCFLFVMLMCSSMQVYASQNAALEKQLIALINEERAKYQLTPLCEWDVLSYYACQHSTNMANGCVAFGHDGFEQRAEAVQQYAFVLHFGENVAYCCNVEDPLRVIVKKWMESPGHRKNILGDYKETGIGIAFNSKGYYYFTQLFSTRYMQ